MLPLNTPMPVPLCDKFPSGWATAEKVTKGDFVYGGNGAPVRVLKTRTQNEQVYRFRLKDYRYLDVGVSCLWKVYDNEYCGALIPRSIIPELLIKEAAKIKDEDRVSAEDAKTYLRRLIPTWESKISLTDAFLAKVKMLKKGGTYPTARLLHLLGEHLSGVPFELLDTQTLVQQLLNWKSGPGLCWEPAYQLANVAISGFTNYDFTLGGRRSLTLDDGLDHLWLADTKGEAYFSGRNHVLAGEPIEPKYLRGDHATRYQVLTGIKDAQGISLRDNAWEMNRTSDSVELVRSLGFGCTAQPHRTTVYPATCTTIEAAFILGNMDTKTFTVEGSTGLMLVGDFVPLFTPDKE